MQLIIARIAVDQIVIRAPRQAVVASTACQNVVARVALHTVVTKATRSSVSAKPPEQHIIVVAAVQIVVAVFTKQAVVAGGAGDDVVARAAIKRIVAARSGRDVLRVGVGKILIVNPRSASACRARNRQRDRGVGHIDRQGSHCGGIAATAYAHDLARYVQHIGRVAVEGYNACGHRRVQVDHSAVDADRQRFG